jgi:AhpC/TSA family protein
MIDSVLAKDKAHTTDATPRDIADVLLAPGTPAPEFTLAAMPGQSLTLSGLAGQPVILAFYPADWSPVCGDQMALYNEVLPTCHAAFAQSRNIADFEPKGAVAKAYRAYRGTALPSGRFMSSTRTG